MTEKRFYYDFEDPYGHKIIDKLTDKSFSLETVEDYCILTDMMSVLSKENEQLKKKLDYESRMHKQYKKDAMTYLQDIETLKAKVELKKEL